jgi:hypothetical protein
MSAGHAFLQGQGVELYLKAGRTPFDVKFVHLKTGKPFRAALKYRTDLYLIRFWLIFGATSTLRIPASN